MATDLEGEVLLNILAHNHSDLDQTNSSIQVKPHLRHKELVKPALTEGKGKTPFWILVVRFFVKTTCKGQFVSRR